MTLADIEEKLIGAITTITGSDKSSIRPEMPFHDLGIDSLGFVEILVFIEKTFSLQLIAADLTRDDFESVRSLAALIARKL